VSRRGTAVNVTVWPRAAMRVALVALLAAALVPLQPAPASAATWVVSTTSRTESEIRARWEALQPLYSGTPYAVTPSVVAPYAAGVAATAFVDDGLRMLNFGRYLAGLPADVTTTSTLHNQAQHGAVLLAASTFSHTPSKPADMDQAFYDLALSSTTSSNIGSGYTDAESFQASCLDDASTSTIARVGHRRWLLNPPMKLTGIGFANNRITTYAFDRSRTDTVDYQMINWPAAGLFPVEFMGARTPWSITLNPARYTWDASGQRVMLKRLSDGRTWSFDASDTNTAGEYFNADFSYIGVRNAFIFRPDPASVTYNPGDEFEVTLAGGIYSASTGAPTTVTYRTRFMSIEGPTIWPEGITVTEIEGENRIATAIETAEAAFPDGADTVLIATAYNWPDALGGAALAGAVDGPILLTDPGALPATVAEEIGRLGASHAIILGGTGAVSTAVESALGTLLGSQSVQRIAGTDRYATARAVAAEAVARQSARPEGYDGTAFMATGAAFPDALGASPLAAANGWPIYLVDPRGVDSATISAMKAAGVKHTIVLGGTGAVSADAQAAISSGVSCSTERIAGATRYETAAEVAAYGVTECDMYWSGVAIATGLNFPDALAGGVLQGRSGAVMLLTPSWSLDPSAGSALGLNKTAISEVRFLGGTGALSLVVRDAVADALR